MYPDVNCDFVENIENGPYCCLDHIACHSEDCEILKSRIWINNLDEMEDEKAGSL